MLILPKPKTKLQARISAEKGHWVNEPKDWREHLGFVYRITHIPSGMFYIGKKLFTSSAGKKKNKKQRKESDWRTYYGSSRELKEMLEKHPREEFNREILSFHDTKFDLMYGELLEQIKHDVVHDPLALNGVLNIRSFIPRSKKKITRKE